MFYHIFAWRSSSKGTETFMFFIELTCVSHRSYRPRHIVTCLSKRWCSWVVPRLAYIRSDGVTNCTVTDGCDALSQVDSFSVVLTVLF